MSERDLTGEAMTRLRRIEGQVRGIQGMLDKWQGCGDGSGPEPCDGLLTQILAVRAAVEQVGVIIMDLHLERCVLDGVPVDEERLNALREALKLWSRLGLTPR